MADRYTCPRCYAARQPGEPCPKCGCPCVVHTEACVASSDRPASCIHCYRFIGGTAPIPPSVLLEVAVLRCAGPKVWAMCRPNPFWGYRCWPGEVLRWRRTRAEVRFWCGRTPEVRTLHYSRLSPRRTLKQLAHGGLP